MNRKNNRKLVIAILIMFLITLSVIGIAYAYFTANFKNNSKDDSVSVKSGKLVAQFKGTNSINVKNVFPGWVSDGKTYYDINAINEEGKLTAKTAIDVATLNSDVTNGIAVEKNGLSNPITFSVRNQSTEKSDINFIIKLKVNVNTFSNKPAIGNPGDADYVPADEDYKNLKVTLYKGTYNSNFDGTTYTNLPEMSVTKTFYTYTVPLANDNQYAELVLVDEAQNLAINAEENYYVVFEYLDNGKQSSQDKELSAEVVISGVEKDEGEGGDNGWYDADNNKITFSTNDGIGAVNLVDKN